MRRSLLPWLLLAAAAHPVTVLATGIGGDSPPTRIPVPAREFSATVEDLSGVTTTLTKVSLNGEVYLYGTLGEAQVTIPFEKIAEVRIEPTQSPDDRIALAKMRDGSTIKIVVRHDLPCYGDTTWGHFKIEIDKLRKITFP